MKITRDIFEVDDTRELQKSLRSLLTAIPAECLRPSSRKSWAYLLFDVSMIALLAWCGLYAWDQGSYALMAIYVFAQGSCFWSLFVIGHDSGHGSFSSRNWENLISGYIAHSFLLIPFYSWKLSHKKHHAYHNMVENDETHVALPKSVLSAFERDFAEKSLFRKAVFIGYLLVSYVGLTFAVYLFNSHALKTDSFNHFNPRAKIFRRHANHIMLSIATVAGMLGLLTACAVKFSVGFVLFMYLAPWLVFSLWIYAVTYLHHTSDKNLWFYAGDWHFLKGALQTIDYDFGKVWGPLINFFHHNIERYHLIHHINSKVPHYNLKKSHEAIHGKIEDVYHLNTGFVRNFFRFKYAAELLVVDDKHLGKKSYSLLPMRPAKGKAS